MRILFVYTIDDELTDFWPVGFAYVIASAAQAGHDVDVLEYVRLRDTDEVFIRRLQELKPRIVAFTSVLPQFPTVAHLARVAKQYSPEIVTVCGGIHPTVCPDSLKDADALDGFLLGEGEVAFLEFADRVARRQPIHDAHNFAYLLPDGTLRQNALHPFIDNLDTLPFPHREGFASSLNSIRKRGIAYVSLSRGCPYSCTFCSNVAYGKAYNRETNLRRSRGVASSIQEIESLRRDFPNVELINFRDEIFGLGRSWLREFSAAYAKKIGLPFICSSRVNVVDEEYLLLLKQAGCQTIYYGVESGNDHIRNTVMKRHMTREMIVDAFRKTHDLGIATIANLVVGVPGETEETLADSIELCRDLRPTVFQPSMFYPFPGSELGDYCYRNDLVDTDKARAVICEPKVHGEGMLGQETVLKFSAQFREVLHRTLVNWDMYVDADRGSAALPGREEYVLDCGRIQPYGPAGYTAVLDIEPDFCDSMENPIRSSFCLYENGTELGPAHAMHETISLKGMGKYSLWGGTLYFSTSDNSDPRTNGRTYCLRHKRMVAPLRAQRANAVQEKIELPNVRDRESARGVSVVVRTPRDLAQVSPDECNTWHESADLLLVPFTEASPAYLEWIATNASRLLNGRPGAIVDAGRFFAGAKWTIPAVSALHLPAVLVFSLSRWPVSELFNTLRALDVNPAAWPAASLDPEAAHELLHRFSRHYYQVSALVTDHCDLQCRMCMFQSTDEEQYDFGVQRRRDRKRQSVPTELLRSFLDQLPARTNVLFSSAGELLMDKGAVGHLAHAVERNLNTLLITNGTQLTAQLAARLLDMGIRQFTISIDGHRQELYEKRRIGAKFDSVVRNVVALKELRDRMHSEARIVINTILFPELVARKEEILDFWRGKADQVSFLAERIDYLGRAPKTLLPLPDMRFCFELLTGPLLLTNGAIAPCCSVAIGEWFEQFPWLCNIRDTGVEEAIGRYRTMMLDPESGLRRFCAKCHYWASSYWQGNRSPYSEIHALST